MKMPPVSSHHAISLMPPTRLGAAPYLAAAFPFLRTMILVIDPHAPVREVISMALRGSGYRVVGCDESESARALLSTYPFAACIMDASLRGDMGGLQLLNWLRARDAAMPVVLTSGMSGHDLGAPMPQDPALRFLAKPFGTRRLIELLTHLIPRPAAAAE